MELVLSTHQYGQLKDQFGAHNYKPLDTFRFAPPLLITKEDIDLALDNFTAILT